MAENTDQYKRKEKRLKKAKKRRQIILFAVEIVIIAAMGFALYTLRDFGKTPIKRVEFSDNDIEMNEPFQNEESKPETMKGYRNIALFGVDSTSGALTQSTRSDAVIIVSINEGTGEVKLVSVYRDTYLNLCSETGKVKYSKCNAAYMYGGAKQAITMLNKNLDLDITDFVTVGFEGLKAAIDELGGIWIDVDSAELRHINSYQITMSKNLKCSYTPVRETGYQKLNGLQAVAYCRIRYTKGDDFKRTERQREVIQAIIDEARAADVQTLVNIANKVTEAEAVYTSLEMPEVLELMANVGKYNIVEEGGFPLEKYRETGKMGSAGDSVLPLDLEKNVIWLHHFLFDDEDYEVSGTVAEYSWAIREKIAEYHPNLKYPE